MEGHLLGLGGEMGQELPGAALKGPRPGGGRRGAQLAW